MVQARGEPPGCPSSCLLLLWALGEMSLGVFSGLGFRVLLWDFGYMLLEVSSGFGIKGVREASG